MNLIEQFRHFLYLVHYNQLSLVKHLTFLPQQSRTQLKCHTDIRFQQVVETGFWEKCL